MEGRFLALVPVRAGSVGTRFPETGIECPLRPLPSLPHWSHTSEISVAAGFARRYALVVLWW